MADPENPYKFEVDNMFDQKGSSSVSWKISAKGIIQMSGKHYDDMTDKEYEVLYNKTRKIAKLAVLDWRVDAGKGSE